MERQSSPNNTNIVISDTEQDSRLGVNSESKNTSGIVNRDDSDVNLIGSSLPNVAEKIMTTLRKVMVIMTVLVKYFKMLTKN